MKKGSTPKKNSPSDKVEKNSISPLTIQLLATFTALSVPVIVILGGLVNPEWWIFWKREVAEITDKPKGCSILRHEPSSKVHVFNGSDEDAIAKAELANIPSVEISKSNKNIAGTQSKYPAAKAEFYLGKATKSGKIYVSGTYEIHAKELGNELPLAALVTLQDGNVVDQLQLQIKTDKLNESIKFEEEIEYEANSVDQAEIRVQNAGAFGLFLDNLSFKACQF